MAAMQALSLSFINTINHNIGSDRRATILSLAGSASQFLFLGVALLFRLLIEQWSVQAAFIVASLPLLTLGLIDIPHRVPWLGRGTKVAEPLAQTIPTDGEAR